MNGMARLRTCLLGAVVASGAIGCGGALVMPHLFLSGNFVLPVASWTLLC